MEPKKNEEDDGDVVKKSDELEACDEKVEQKTEEPSPVPASSPHPCDVRVALFEQVQARKQEQKKEEGKTQETPTESWEPRF